MINYNNSPRPKKIVKKLTKHSDVRLDEYYWLNERENSEVIDYLNNENNYYEIRTSHTKNFQSKLFEEMKARIKKNDSSVPYKYNGYWYITRYEKDKDYPIYVRKKGTLKAKDELLLDCNKLALGHKFFNLRSLNVSSNNQKLAFSTDTIGRREYTIFFKDLSTNQILKDKINNTTGGCTWANDNQSLFYTRQNAETLRPEIIYMHKLGDSSKNDRLIFKEEDETFGVGIYKTKSMKYLVISSYSTLTSEYRILNANTPDERFKIFQPRTAGLEYSISHYDDSFYIISNAGDSKNFKLSKTNEKQTGIKFWQDVIPHRENVLLEGIDIFKDFLVISERENGLNKINIQSWDGKINYYVPFSGETYTAYTSTNIDFDTNILRYGYQSLITPNSIIDFNMITKRKTLRKKQEVLGNDFNEKNYVSDRIWATSRDGTKIPISLVRHIKTKRSSETPLLLYAYGSYGSTIDPYFSSNRLSLLDRGFIFAIAHVRGGQYLGREWYEDGKLLNKKNTFNDFIDCSKFLISSEYTSKDHLYAMGGSAGGLLMGAVINMAPQLYNGVVSAVPFVDVITTMLDETIPLTTGEYDEWGDPNNKIYYDYMKSYSPYDNIKNQPYPNLLVTAGLHDSQVQFWEPAKWVAKLRDQSNNSSLLLLKTNMSAGHGGASGRFESLKEVAAEYAFFLDLEHALD